MRITPSKKVPNKAVHLPVLAEELQQPVLLNDPSPVDGEGVRIVIRDPLILTPEPGVVKQHRIREIQTGIRVISADIFGSVNLSWSSLASWRAVPPSPLVSFLSSLLLRPRCLLASVRVNISSQTEARSTETSTRPATHNMHR